MALQQQNTASPNTSAERLTKVEMALEALRNVIRNNPGKQVADLQRTWQLFVLNWLVCVCYCRCYHVFTDARELSVRMVCVMFKC